MSEQTLVAVYPTERTMKRILLFVMTNLAVVLVLGVVASLLGETAIHRQRLNLGALLGFALVMGFGGAIISLLISKPVAKWSSGARDRRQRLA